jgi:hypothetical protein
MKSPIAFLYPFLGFLLCIPIAGPAQVPPEQAFAASVPPAGIAGDPAVGNAQDGSLFAEGTRAINEGRWDEAEAIFAKVADLHGEHADGALYWKAYAENKQGQTKPALDACGELRRNFPSSSWIHECGALEIEIHAKSGQPVQPDATQDDDLKLLALNSLMRRDEPRALAQIEEILNGDSSPKLKQGALFILTEHHAKVTYPQIVRIRYVEGDVRVWRGKQEGTAADPTWEKAVAGLPLETGFSLATGAGRAEIEFENASTLYLAENSVLTFNDLRTTVGVPYSEMALLTGTATLHIKPFIAGEWFVVKTPTDNFAVQYPEKVYARIDSYVDAMAITPQSEGTLRLPGTSQLSLVKGKTLLLRNNNLVEPESASDENAFADWDNWVRNRVTQRSEAIAEVMKASGLAQPIPGLAEMKDQGTFFDCAPYGTCWEPATAEERQPASGRERQLMGDNLAESRPVSADVSLESERVVSPESGRVEETVSPTPLRTADYLGLFPCLPTAIRYRTARDPMTGRRTVIDSAPETNSAQWNWAVCHAGAWIHRGHRYVWVASHRRRHQEPVRWVRSGRTVAFVPLHPYDIKDQPPGNRKEDAFTVSDKNGLSMERIRFNPDRPIELLKSPPKEFRIAALPPLSHAEDPHLAAHQIKDEMGNRTALAKAGGIPLSFDHGSQNFMMSRQVMHGNRSTTVIAPVTNRGGNLQARAGGFSGGSHGGAVSSSSGGHSGGGSVGSSVSASTSSSSSSAVSSSASSSSAGSSSTSGGHR